MTADSWYWMLAAVYTVFVFVACVTSSVEPWVTPFIVLAPGAFAFTARRVKP